MQRRIRIARAAQERTGQASLAKTLLRYVFPDHWSFLWGEIALYCFVVLVATGVYLALFFDASSAQTVYHGSYAPLRGQKMSEAYRSVIDLSFSVKAGLLMRQTHHWAANVFIAAIVMHMLRVFFTGAYRKPREIIWYLGVTMFSIAMLEGYLGYSLIDDLISGMGLVIGWSVLMSVPLVGGPAASLLWGGPFPGDASFESRLYIAHVLLIPGLLAVLISAHLLFIALLRHTQFAGPGRTQQNVLGSPLWPTYAPRSLGLFCATAGVLFMLGGLVQVNPVWLWGPYHTYVAENGAQPDWYIGWLIGALRTVPNVEPVVGGVTVVPNPFWGGVLFPTVVIGLLYAWPTIEKVVSGDRQSHHLLDRPRDAPWRTAFGAAFLTWVMTPFFEAAGDRLYVQFDVPYQTQVDVFRVLWVVAPLVAFAVTYRTCRALARSGGHPLRTQPPTLVRRGVAGGFDVLDSSHERDHVSDSAAHPPLDD